MWVSSMWQLKIWQKLYVTNSKIQNVAKLKHSICDHSKNPNCDWSKKKTSNEYVTELKKKNDKLNSKCENSNVPKSKSDNT